MARIFLVDDHPLLRQGVSAMLDRHDDLELCGQADTAAKALDEIPACNPDLVVMDMTLPDKNGLEVIKDLQAICPDIPILILSMHDEMLYAERVIRAGARGFIMKESAGSQLVDGIRKALAGGIVLSQAASSHILAALSSSGPGESRFRIDQLTDREIEIFELIGQGKNAHEIADHLNISPRTVDAHRAHIREKLDLPDSPSLLRYAVRWVETGNKGELADSD